MGDYFDQYVSEVRHAKPITGKGRRAISRRPGGPQAAHVRDPCAADLARLRRILEPAADGPDAHIRRSAGAMAELVEFSNVRDWRVPYAKGHPSPRQSCAKLAWCAEGVIGVTYCGARCRRERPSRRGPFGPSRGPDSG